MRAVTGSVVSSAPVSLKRAAAIISNFVVADTGARPEISVYSSRASRAFNELLELHREIRSSRGGGVENDELSQQRDERHSKRKRKEIEIFNRIEQHGVGINHVPRIDNSAAEMDVRTTMIKERTGVDGEGSSRVGGVQKKMKERVMTVEGSSSRKEAEGMGRNREAELAERGEKHKEEEFDENRTSEERKKKKRDTQRNVEEDVNVEEGGDKSGKKRKHLEAGNEEGGLVDRSERHHKKKRRKEV